jgi:hypothetical protein
MDESSFKLVSLKDDFVKEANAASTVSKQLDLLAKSKQCVATISTSFVYFVRLS